MENSILIYLLFITKLPCLSFLINFNNMLYLIACLILINLAENKPVDTLCGLTTPEKPEDCHQYSNSYYTCCYVDLNFTTSYSPKGCYGIINAFNVTFPKEITQFTINSYDCGTSITPILTDNMFCGSNVTSISPGNCFNSSNFDMNCCEFTFDNFGVCVDTTQLGDLKSTINDYIVCDSSYPLLSIILLLYVILV